MAIKRHITKNNFLAILWIIVGIGFLLRIGVSYQLAEYNNGHNSVLTPSSQTDMATYMALSETIAKGEYRDLFYYQPFYYAVFLPVIKLVFGFSAHAVYVVQAIIGALTILLGGVCAAQLRGRLAGFWTAVFIALSSALILYTPFHLIATLQSFWMVLLLYCTLIASHRRNWFRWSIVGLVTGCSILTRGNAWFFVPGILAFLVYTQLRKDAKLKVSKKIIHSVVVSGAFLFFVILPQLPFVYHNSSMTGKFTGPSTAAGAVLALGNTPEAPAGGREPGSLAGPMEYPVSYHVWTSGAAKKSVPARIIEWFKEEPGAFIELTFRKMLLFWDYREIPNNISYVGEGKKSWIFTYLALMPTGFIIAFGLAGIFVLVPLYRKKKGLLFVSYLICAYWLATAAFYILCRFRVPVLPYLAVLGGCYIQYFVTRYKVNHRIAYAIFGTALCISVYFTFTAYEFYRNNIEEQMMRSVRPNGVSLRFDDGKLMQLDHGPITLGGWNGESFAPGTVLQKKFADIPGSRKPGKAQFEITLGVEQPGRMVLEVNGEMVLYDAQTQGMNTAAFEIASPADGTVTIKLVSSEIPVFYFVDYQRDYGRSSVNGQKIPAELVCRIYYLPPQKEKPAEKPKPEQEITEPGVAT